MDLLIPSASMPVWQDSHKKTYRGGGAGWRARGDPKSLIVFIYGWGIV